MLSGLKQKIKQTRWNTWFGLAGLGIFFLALRWNSFSVPLDRDEGDYAYAARLLVQGLAPYEHIFIQKPPMVIYSYALAHLMAPHLFWFARLGAYLSVALATALLGYIAWLEFGAGVAFPAMGLMTPMVLLPEITQFGGCVEMWLLFPLMGAIAIYCHSRKNGNRACHWFAAAFLAVTAILYKYTALPMLAFAFAVWCWELYRTGNRKQLGRGLLAAVAGAFLAIAIEVGYFLVHDGGKGLWECTIVFNRYYAGSGIFGWAMFLAKVKTFWSAWWILFLVPWASLLLANRRKWFWYGMLLCALVATGSSAYGQYYIVVMPFWALLSAMGIRALISEIDKRSKLSAWAGAMMVAGVVIFAARSDVPWLLCSSQRFAEVKMDGYPFLDARWAAAQVSQLTTPDDFIYVAGSEPEIMDYTERFSPTRFSNVYPLMVPSPAAQRYQREAIQALQLHPPALIVYIQSPTSWVRHPTTPPDFNNFLRDFMARDYRLIGGYLNGKNKFHTTLSTNEFAAADLLLLERNDWTGAAKKIN
ncbi:MAG: ArnT family glycosyltransferase [Limisphaerales bacterium]